MLSNIHRFIRRSQFTSIEVICSIRSFVEIFLEPQLSYTTSENFLPFVIHLGFGTPGRNIFFGYISRAVVTRLLFLPILNVDMALGLTSSRIPDGGRTST